MEVAQKSIVANSVYRGLLSFFNLVVPLLVTPYVFRVLAPAQIGEVEYATSIYTYFSLFGILGIYTYGIREASKIRDRSNDIQILYANLFRIGLCSNIIVAVVFVVFTWLTFSTAPIFVILLVLAGNFIANVFYTEWINEAYEDFKFIAIKTIIVRSIFVLSIFLLIKQSSDVSTYVFLIVLFNFINYYIGFVYARRYTGFRLFNKTTPINYKKYLLPLFFILILNNSSIFYTQLDRVMLGSYNSNTDVAYYSLGQKIMEIVRALLLTLTYVTLPRLSYYLENDYKSYIHNVAKLLRIVLMIAIPMSFGICLFSDIIVQLFAGEQYSLAILPLFVFGIRITTLMIENVTAQQVLFLHGKEKTIAIFNVIFGLLNMIFNFILVYWGGFSALTAIISTLVAEVLLLAAEFIYIRKNFHVNLSLFKQYNLYYIVFSLLFIPIVMITRLVIHNIYMVLVVSIPICITLYFGGLFFVKDQAFIELKSRIIK